MALSEFSWRVLVTLVGIPLTLAAAVAGDWPLATLLALFAGIAAWELMRIARAAGHEPFTNLTIALAALVPLVVRASLGEPPSSPSLVVHSAVRALHTTVVSQGTTIIALVSLIVLSLTIFRRGPQRRPLASAAVTLFGVLYTGGLLSFAYALRSLDYAIGAAAGAAVLLFPMVLTWTTDTGAYLVGRAIGRRKLLPAVSPSKTVEGALGGLALAIIAGWAYERWVLGPRALLMFAPGAVILFAMLVSISVQLGDLFESMLKREAGVKDSSHVIPGHGGVLDRFDGLLFAMPTAYWLFHVLRLIPVVR
ncbi:MAG: phosphatidate cytidylyltransferase [Gemmatimonadaceae bacterium]